MLSLVLYYADYQKQNTAASRASFFLCIYLISGKGEGADMNLDIVQSLGECDFTVEGEGEGSQYEP